VKTQTKAHSILFNIPGILTVDDILNILKKHSVEIDKNSPDVSFICPTKNSISIDEIRDLKKYIFQQPVKSKFRIVVVTQAHKLTTQAQNAFLKLLEEPPPSGKIILFTNSPKNLLPTVRSRLVEIKDINFPEQKTETHDELTIRDLISDKIEDPSSFINNEIIKGYENLKKAVDKKEDPKPIEENIELAHLTKKMISANVNPKFALLNYFLNTKHPK